MQHFDRRASRCKQYKCHLEGSCTPYIRPGTAIKMRILYAISTVVSLLPRRHLLADVLAQVNLAFFVLLIISLTDKYFRGDAQT